MSLRKKVKDERLQTILANLAEAKEQGERGFKKLRRAWSRFDRLMYRVRYLERRAAKRERELEAEASPNGAMPQ